MISTDTGETSHLSDSPIPLWTVLRRVIATNADPDAAAHRAVGATVAWLRKKADTEDAIGGVVLRGLAREIEAETAAAEDLEGGQL